MIALSIAALSAGPGIRYSSKSRGPWSRDRVVGLGRLEERVRDPHPGAALDLLLGHRRVDRPADLVDVVQREHLDDAGLVVDLDVGHGARVRLAGVRVHLAGLRHRVGALLEEDAAPGDRAALLEVRGQREVDDVDLLLLGALELDEARCRRSPGPRRQPPSSSAAAASMISRASCAAMITALPTRCVPREANVPMQCGPVSVSAVSTMMFS